MTLIGISGVRLRLGRRPGEYQQPCANYQKYPSKGRILIVYLLVGNIRAFQRLGITKEALSGLYFTVHGGRW